MIVIYKVSPFYDYLHYVPYVPQIKPDVGNPDPEDPTTGDKNDSAANFSCRVCFFFKLHFRLAQISTVSL